MPTAPLAQRQVVDQAVPGVRVSAAPTADTFGAGIGESIASTSVRMYDLQTRSSDHAAVVEAETLANAEQLRIQQDVLSLKGKDAANAPQYAQEEWGKVHQDRLRSLANDRQRAMYNSIGLQKGEIINRGALQHFNQEDERYQDETYKANLSSSVNVARANADSPVAVAFEKDLQRMRVDERAQKYGYANTPQHEAEITAIHSATNREVITGLLDKGQDLRAKAFYDRIMKDEKARPTELQFTAQDRDVVDKAIFEGSTRGASRRTAQGLIDKFGIETAEQRKQIKAAVNEIKDDKVADLTMQRIEHEYQAFDQIQNQVKDERFKGAIAGIDEQLKAGNKLPPLEMVRPSDLAEMSVQERHVIEEYVKHKRDPGKKVTNIKVWATASSMLDADLAKLGVSEILAIVNQLDDGNTDTFMTRWNGVLNGRNGQKDVKFERLQNNMAILKNERDLSGFFKIGVPVDKMPEDHQRLWNRIEKEAGRVLNSIPAGAPEEVIQKAMKRVVEDATRKLIVDRSAFSFNIETGVGNIEDFKDARSIRIPLKDISEDRQNALKGALRSAGMPITTQNIEELEAKAQMKRRGVK